MTSPRSLPHTLRIITFLWSAALMCTACGPLGEASEKAKNILGKLRPDDPARPCFQHEECFAGEYCAEGVCAPYTCRTVGRPVDRPDLSSYLYDLGDDPDMDDVKD